MDDFDRSLSNDRDEADLLIIIGTSLKVSPVSEILCASRPLYGYFEYSPIVPL
jgi:NAD-dependent SIR2 family protein deacetylase